MNWKRLAGFWLIFLLTWGMVGNTFAQTKQPQAKKTRLLFLLDASGSMQAKWENSQRWIVAKNMLARMADSLDSYANLEIALRVYGHQFASQQKNCKDTKLEVPFAPHNAEAIKKRLQQITPKGNTPITYSLQQSANDFPTDANTRNIIIIITDGVESCGGDPCATSIALQKKQVFLKPFIIGLGDDPNYEQQFGCMGQYYNASDIKTFRRVLNSVIDLALKKTTVSVVLTDEAGRSVESNINVTFKNNVTGRAEYNFIHYMDAAGRPDAMEIDALQSYDLLVNTLPAVELPNIEIQPGKHNVFKVKVPQGNLYLRQEAPTGYGALQALVSKPGNRELLHAQPFPSQQKYLTGNYEIELLTLPRIRQNVTIKQGQTTTITFPPPGTLYLPQNLLGYGSIYELDSNGSQRWIYNMPESASKFSLTLQPGRYRLVYRYKTAVGSKFTDVQDFNIKSNTTTALKLFN